MSVLKIKDGNTWKSIPTIKGEKGDKGDAPVKGTDYWTAADKAAMVQDVLDALDEAEGVSY